MVQPGFALATTTDAGVATASAFWRISAPDISGSSTL